MAVGTTGRILSLIQRGALKTGAVRMLVLDEADKLLGGECGSLLPCLCVCQDAAGVASK